MPTRWRPLCLAFLPLLALSLVACGDADAPTANPAEEAPVFVRGDFGAIPVHPLADEVGPRSRKDGVTAQSFEVRNLSKEQLFEWYDDHLPAWKQQAAAAPLTATRDAAWRASWTRDDRQLIVTASDAPTLSGENGDTGPRLQFSLSLEPLGG